eukprot:1145904-Pelagomonas_calceolata.AAC.4
MCVRTRACACSNWLALQIQSRLPNTKYPVANYTCCTCRAFAQRRPSNGEQCRLQPLAFAGKSSSCCTLHPVPAPLALRHCLPATSRIGAATHRLAGGTATHLKASASLAAPGLSVATRYSYMRLLKGKMEVVAPISAPCTQQRVQGRGDLGTGGSARLEEYEVDSVDPPIRRATQGRVSKRLVVVYNVIAG